MPSRSRCFCAQSDPGTVTGIVTDSAQAVVPDVSIAVRHVDTNEPHIVATNAEGYYTVANLPPGKYELIVEKSDFRAYRQTGITMETGQTLRIDVQLSVGPVTETVSVQAQAAPLNTENGSIKGDVIVNQEIQAMPLNGRDFTELALLVPGVLTSLEELGRR